MTVSFKTLHKTRCVGIRTIGLQVILCNINHKYDRTVRRLGSSDIKAMIIDNLDSIQCNNKCL
jgi:hypothetical protein